MDIIMIKCLEHMAVLNQESTGLETAVGDISVIIVMVLKLYPDDRNVHLGGSWRTCACAHMLTFLAILLAKILRTHCELTEDPTNSVTAKLK